MDPTAVTTMLTSQFLGVRRSPVARRPSRAPAPARAYTLVELLIVISLLGLASSLLVPYMVGRSTLETQAAVRMIIVDLNFAQSDALANQEFRRVHFFEDGRGYCIVRVTQDNFDSAFDPDTADYIYDPLGRAGVLRQYIVDFAKDKRFEGVSISSAEIDGNNAYISYDQLGGTVGSGGSVPGTGGAIIVSSEEATYRINIAPFTGKLTVEKIN